MMETIFIWIFSCAFILFGFLALESFFKARRRIADSQRWLRAAAQLDSIEVIEKKRRKSGHTFREYRVEFCFSYKVNSSTYQGSEKNIWLSGRVLKHQLPEEAEAAAAQWRSLDEIPVYFNPTNPAECCIERENPSAAYGNLAIAFGMFAFGLGFLGVRYESFLLGLFG